MSEPWDPKPLLQPIAADKPCGDDLELTGALSALDEYQIFGQAAFGLGTLERDPDEPARREARKSDRPPKWPEIRNLSLEMLATSKDLRALAYLGAGLLQTNGITALFDVYGVAAQWLTDYWPDVYPRPEGNLVARTSALDCLADPIAIIDRLRRAPIVSHPKHGKVSLRDLEILAGKVEPGKDARPEEVRVITAFAETAIDELRQVRDSTGRATMALAAIEQRMRQEPAAEGAPAFEGLSRLLGRLEVVLRTELARHPSATPEETGAAALTEGEATARGAQALGAVQSREDAIRALEAVADFFRRSEPSSPIPLFVDRAKRLVSKDFLDVLADVAPEGLTQARLAGGVKTD